MRLIDADAINLRYTIGMIADDGVVCVPLKDVCKSIGEAPTIDAVPVVHGRWVFVEVPDLSWYGHKPGWYCSRCGWFIEDKGRKPKTPQMRFCPNCGAKMDGDADENHL